MTPRAWLRRAAALDWYRLACALLALWCLGLVIAVAQLESWRRDLTHTLMQLHADEQFRSRLAQRRDAIDPAWFRRKALSLLAATEAMRHDTAWSLFMPGSWEAFDNLEERVAARIEREFGEIVVETIRLELLARAGALTGDCRPPAPDIAQRTLSAAPQDMPEYVALRNYVGSLEELDAAVQAFLTLQQSRTAQPQQLRLLVKYALGAELPGRLERTVPLFHTTEEVSVQPALMLASMRWSTRCSLLKGLDALQARLLSGNQLIALEQSLKAHSAGLFDAHAKPQPFDRTLERYRAVAALLADEDALLARGGNDWMRHATLQLGPGYEDMLARLERMRLVGPEALQDWHRQSAEAFAQFRRQFDSAFGHDEPGIVWLEPQRRFALSPQRAALRSGLQALLREPFMADDAKVVRVSHLGLAPVLPELHELASSRESFAANQLPLFPEFAREAVRRTVDLRVADLVYQKAFRALKGAMPVDVATPLDPVTYRRQGELVAEVQELLDDVGAAPHAQRLGAAHAGELRRRFALLDEEASPVWEVFGADDTAQLQRALAEQVARLETLGHRATALLALAEGPLARDPALQRWRKLVAELDRYRARQPDSSLLALERFVQFTGPELKRDTCAERLALQPVLRYDDDIALRLTVLHKALLTRCGALHIDTARLPPPS